MAACLPAALSENSWPRDQVLRGAIGHGEPIAFYLGTLTWISNMRTRWSHPLPGPLPHLMWKEHCGCSDTSTQGLAPTAQVSYSETLLLPGLKGSEGSSPHLREAPGVIEGVRNIHTQKPLNAYQNRNKRASECARNWVPEWWREGVRLEGDSTEMLLEATSKLPSAQVSIPGRPHAVPVLPERNPTPAVLSPPELRRNELVFSQRLVPV